MADAGQLHRKRATFGKAPEVLIHDLTITDGAVRQYTHMHWRYGQNHQNWESQRSMAEMLGVSDTAVANRIKELEGKDWVVVVLRGKSKKGTYQTPYYHVFEDPQECREFRQSYVCAKGEIVRSKPEQSRQRKTRAGAGGKPENLKTIPTQVGTDTIPTQVGTAHTNPGWDNLESVDLDSNNTAAPQNGAGSAPVSPSKEKQPAFTNGAGKDTPPIAPAPPQKKPRERDVIFDLVALHSFGLKEVVVGASRIAAVANTLKKLDPPPTEAEIKAFYNWYKSNNENAHPPRDAAKLGMWFTKYRQSRPKPRPVQPPPTDAAPVMSEAERAENQAKLLADVRMLKERLNGKR